MTKQPEEIPGEVPVSDVPTLVLSNTEDVLKLGSRLDGIKLVVLEFPKFTDGRAYTQARLLRERLGYSGELRASGAVYVDQLPFLLRCGFDSFASTQKGFAEAVVKAREVFSVFYQPVGDGRATATELRLAQLCNPVHLAAD